MKSTRLLKNRKRNTQRLYCAELLEPRRLLSTVAWDGGPTGNGTNFLDPVNWVGDALPATGDTATIGTTGTNPAITISGTPAVKIVNSSRSLQLTGGTLSGGTWTFSSGASLVPTNSGGTLSSVAISGELSLNTTSATVLLAGNTSFTAARLSANNAQLQMAPGYTLNSLVSIEGAATGTRYIYLAAGGSGTVTFGSSAIVRLASGSGGDLLINDSSPSTLVNGGLISAEATGHTLVVNNTTLTNNGTLQVTAGALTVQPTTWTNTGTVTGTGGTFNIGGTFDATGASGIGTFSTSAITVNITGTITNTGRTITLNAATGSWNLFGGGISNGSVNETAGSSLLGTSNGGKLSSVAITGDLLLNTTSANVTLAGNTSFTAARLSANNAQLQMAPGYTLNSLVSIEGAATGTRYIYLAAGGSGTVTFGSSAIVRLASGSGGDLLINDSSPSTLVNGGLISAEATGHTLVVNNTTLTNNGTLQVTAGALTVQPTTWTNTGTVTGTGGTFNIGGTFDATGASGIGTFSTSAITVNITGTITNTGRTITLNAATGSWNLFGGGISNGSVNETAGSSLLGTSNGGKLSSVAITGDLLLNTTSANVTLAGNTSFTAARLSANNAQLQMAPGYTLNSLVSIEGAATGTRYIYLAAGGSGTVTFGSSAIVRLASGSGGDLLINDSSPSTLVNGGLISAEATGHTLVVNNTTLTNNGTLQVTAGTLTVQPTTWTNTGTVTGTGGTFNIGGTFDATGASGIGTFSTSAITVNITGTITNTGRTITLNAATGSWNLFGGGISNGSVNETAGSSLLGTSNGGKLSSVAITGDLLLNTTSANVTLAGNTSFTAARLSANNAQLQMAPGYTLNSLVSIEGAATGTRYIYLAAGGSGTVTFGSSAIVRLASGSGGDLLINDSSPSTLVNGGLISAEATGHTLVVNNTTLTNNGTLQVTAGTLTVQPTTFTDSGTLQASAGTISVTSPTTSITGIAQATSPGIINLDSPTSVTVGAAATASVSRFRTASLTIAGSAVVIPNGSNAATTVIKTLAFSGSGKLDLNDNDLILDYTGAAQRATIQGYVSSGRAGGAWTGGPITSTAAKNNPKHDTTLGVLEATEYESISAGNNSFDGQSLDTTAVLIKYTYYGDSDFNGKIDANDYGRIDSGYQNQNTAGFTADWFTGDFNYDGKIDANDYALIDGAYQTQTTVLRSGDATPLLPTMGVGKAAGKSFKFA